MTNDLGPDGFEGDPRHGTRQRDALVEELNSRLGQIDRLEDALRAIRGPQDEGYWIEVYREHGGGYEGLQAIAEAALAGPAQNVTEAEND